MIKEYLKSFNLLLDKEIDEFIRVAQPKVLKKGDHFIFQGEVCREIGFVNSGLLRSYYYSEKGEDVTTCFYFANTFLTAYSSLISGLPSVESIEAIADVQLISLSKASLNYLENSHANWLKFSKVMAEREYLVLEKRNHMLQSKSAEAKYIDLLTNHSEYLKQIPLKYLASYLGITQRHLSRIRSSISN